MIEARQKDKARILEYLRGSLQDCIYLYIDIMNYGISSDNMKVWYDEERSRINLVVMKYYDSFQIYSHNPFCDISPITELLQEYPVTMISGRREMIEQLEKEWEAYRASYGAVFIMDKYRKLKEETDILTATREDTEEIAALICSDEEIGGHYTIEGLEKQLAERIRTGTGRSYIIRQNGRIAAHSATYAEAEGIAVVGGTIIRPECRNENYYMLLSNYMLQQLAKEGKTAYTFSLSDKMIRYHERLHTKCGEYGKLVKMR